jgi:hypothetical protein
MQVMTTCWACEASLDPVWKYCTQCGVPIERDAAPTPEPTDVVAAPSSISPLAVFGLIMGGIALVIGGSAVVLFLVLRQ